MAQLAPNRAKIQREPQVAPLLLALNKRRPAGRLGKHATQVRDYFAGFAFGLARFFLAFLAPGLPAVSDIERAALPLLPLLEAIFFS